jgi:hypothetical protein
MKQPEYLGDGVYVSDAPHLGVHVVVAGGPRSGKSSLAMTLASHIGGDVACTDQLMGQGLTWSEESQKVADWFNPVVTRSVAIVEGVVVPRALRKWLRTYETGKPCVRAVYLRGAHGVLTSSQENMSKGCWTVFSELIPELEKRGVLVEVR